MSLNDCQVELSVFSQSHRSFIHIQSWYYRFDPPEVMVLTILTLLSISLVKLIRRRESRAAALNSQSLSS